MTIKSDDDIHRYVEDFKAGRPVPEGVVVHVSHSPTQADWDALDPNSYETTCAKCDTPYDGQFGPEGELSSPCPQCGSMEIQGGICSPAGAFSLAMRSDFE